MTRDTSSGNTVGRIGRLKNEIRENTEGVLSVLMVSYLFGILAFASGGYLVTQDILITDTTASQIFEHMMWMTLVTAAIFLILTHYFNILPED